jgi:hypothetical protein
MKAVHISFGLDFEKASGGEHPNFKVHSGALPETTYSIPTFPIEP